MELRVPGIGGPSPESVLGCPPNHAVPTWRSESPSRSMVRHAAGGDGSVHVYDWRPLTSGSRKFVVWPLLAPFTLVNVAGWMGPPDPGRAWVHRWVGVLLGLLVTVQCVVWLVVAGVDGWVVFLGADSASTAYWAGVATAAVAMGLLVTGATYMASGYERYRRPDWERAGVRPGPTWRHPWGRGITLTTADEHFYDGEREHKAHWYVHVVVAAVTTVVTVALTLGSASRLPVAGPRPRHGGRRRGAAGGHRRARPRRPPAGLVGPAARRPAVCRRRGDARRAAARRPRLGGDDRRRGRRARPVGPTMMLFELYGWVAFAVLALGGFITLFAAETPSVAEGSTLEPPLLGSPVARVRARVAPAVARADVVLALVAVAVPVAAAAFAWVRWFDNDDGHRWRLTSSLGVTLGRWTVFAVAGFMIVNLVKSRANPTSLRRIGNLWDVLTFWPRTFHRSPCVPTPSGPCRSCASSCWHGPRNSPLVVTAHSQGSVITLAAIEPVLGEVRDSVGLVTFGSPLHSLYRRFFPRCFSAERTGAARTALGDRWRNLFRFTDHVGRAVFVDDADALQTFATHGRARARRPARPADPRPVTVGSGARRPQPLLGRARGPRRRRAGELTGSWPISRNGWTPSCGSPWRCAAGSASRSGSAARAARSTRAARRHGPHELLDRLAAPRAATSAVVVDVLAGASAGGLNGVLYAASQVYGFPYAQIREIWLRLGSTENLVRRGEPYPSLFLGDEFFQRS